MFLNILFQYSCCFLILSFEICPFNSRRSFLIGILSDIISARDNSAFKESLSRNALFSCSSIVSILYSLSIVEGVPQGRHPWPPTSVRVNPNFFDEKMTHYCNSYHRYTYRNVVYFLLPIDEILHPSASVDPLLVLYDLFQTYTPLQSSKR